MDAGQAAARDRVLGHYRIVEKIGEGGMGLVYRAHDERLDRDVAVKVLPTGAFADEAARKRFRKEALALSKLNHPNIATVHDLDSEAETDFLIEEFIEGVSLDQMLLSGTLTEKKIINLGAQLCDALAAAHKQGIIHRDLKPGNIRITPDARLKILDFGLAKMLRPGRAGDADATLSASETQTACGTLPYMAPEQLLNEKLDTRTDIWAAGCVFYEMATGQRPFGGSGAALVDSILHQQPKAPTELTRKISPGLEAIILKCLEKDPGLRYASAQDVGVDLHRLETGTLTKALGVRRRATALKVTAVVMMVVILAAAGWVLYRRTQPRVAQIHSIAVLPLANLSGDPQQEYFADGMTESLITDLGRFTRLKTVIARGSVMRYKGTKLSPAEIARELKVDALIAGAVLRSGDRVRVTVQLINPQNGEQLWTENYERNVSDVLRLQSELTRAIAGEIRVKLTASEQAQWASARPLNPETYDAYLMGRFHSYKMSPRGLDTALEYFQLALEKDPNYAPAYAGISYVWVLRSHNGLVPAREGWPKAKTAALKALELDDNLPEAHDALGTAFAGGDWNWAAAEREYRRSIELNPNYANVRCFYSFFLYAMGRQDEAKRQAERAVEWILTMRSSLRLLLWCWYARVQLTKLSCTCIGL